MYTLWNNNKSDKKKKKKKGRFREGEINYYKSTYLGEEFTQFFTSYYITLSFYLHLAAYLRIS